MTAFDNRCIEIPEYQLVPLEDCQLYLMQRKEHLANESAEQRDKIYSSCPS